MKEIRVITAAFAIALLIIPFISVKIYKSVQQYKMKYSSKAFRKTAAAQNVTASQPETFKIYLTSVGKVTSVPAQDYVCGVVAAEVPVSYRDEAIKAQAVAAFTYACRQREYNRSHAGANSSIQGADLSDDYHSYEAYLTQDQLKQEWGNSFEENFAKIKRDVEAVKGKAAVYQGSLIDAAFFSVSSGMTESSENVWGTKLPYLVSVKSEWDRDSSDYRSGLSFDSDDFKKKVQAKYSDAKFAVNPASWISGIRRSAAGGVLQAVLCGKTVNGSDIRSLFGLKSTNFQVNFQGGKFVFDVRGDGHGVGMSQYGAEVLASQGKSYEQILKYYYTGIDIVDYSF